MSETTGLPSVDDVARVGQEHGPFGEDGRTWVCEVCGVLSDADTDTHPARIVLALFEAAVPRIQAEALREASRPLTQAGEDFASKLLRRRADRIEREAGKQ